MMMINGIKIQLDEISERKPPPKPLHCRGEARWHLLLNETEKWSYTVFQKSILPKTFWNIFNSVVFLHEILRICW